MSEYFDRYQSFRNNGQVSIIPPISIEVSSTDLFITYEKSKMRLDNLSYKYFGDSNYGWLIMLANPKYNCMEFELPDRITLRIPYPLSDALNRYNASVNKYIN